MRGNLSVGSSSPAGQETNHSFIHKSFLRGIAIGLGVSLLVSLLSFMGFLRNWENGIFDFLVWWEREKRSTDVFLIEIDDGDYEALFRATSPLPRTILAELLLRLARTRPGVIAVDIDLAGNTPDDRYLIDALEDISKMKIPVVLPYEITENMGENIRTVPVIPGDPIDTLKNVYSGAVNFPISRDGVVREMLIVQGNPSGDVYPLFSLSVVAAFKGIPWSDFMEAFKSPREERRTHSFDKEVAQILEDAHHSPVQKIRYIGDKRSFSSIKASSLLSMPLDSFTSQNILSGKILLIGGTFKFSKDFYQTPKGLMSGVEIVANSVETLLTSRIVRPVNHFLEFLFELGIVLVLSCFFLWFSELRAIIMSLLLILPLSIIGSLVAFSNFHRWLNFLPVGLAIVFHGQFSFLEHFSQLKKEVVRLQNLVAQRDREIFKKNREIFRLNVEKKQRAEEEEPKEER